MSSEPEDIELAKPKSWMMATSVREADGSESPLPNYEQHLMCDADGKFPAEMNTWELKVFETEKQRQGYKAWYRNPSRPSQDSLGVTYNENGQFKIVRP